MGTLPKSGSVTVEVEASPDQVWTLLADIARAGEWSHETQGGEWLDGATGPAVGARFRGSNKNGRMRWSRVCEVTTADAPRTIAWRTVRTRLYPDSSVWTFDLEPTERGCRITQRFDVVSANPIADRLFYALIPAHRDRSAALRQDLVSLGEVAAQPAGERRNSVPSS